MTYIFSSYVAKTVRSVHRSAVLFVSHPDSLKCFRSFAPKKQLYAAARKTRTNVQKPFDTRDVNQMCTSLLKLHCRIFRCILFTQRNTIQMCSQATQTTAPTLSNSSASSPEECFSSYRLCNRSEPCSSVRLLFPVLADQSSGNGRCQGRAAMLPSVTTLGTRVITSS